MEESEDERYEDVAESNPWVELPPCELARLENINEVSDKRILILHVFDLQGNHGDDNVLISLTKTRNFCFGD